MIWVGVSGSVLGLLGDVRGKVVVLSIVSCCVCCALTVDAIAGKLITRTRMAKRTNLLAFFLYNLIKKKRS